ncbi:MAG: DNA polymerase I [Bacteroidota bacterium]
MAEKKLFLLDGHALVYRAHFAFITRPLINSKGFNTSAITGFVRTLWDLMRKQQPTHLAVSFDTHVPTFRHEMYEPYKANREEQPEDIGAALPYIKEILKAFKIPIVTKDGYEADDVIGTLAKQAEKEGFKVYMVTPDKDFAQLVSQNVFLYKPARMGNDVAILGEDEVLAKWEIERVEQVIDILGLQGDSVDNIPGIPGIGKKTAIKLLAKYGSVEGLLANTHELKGKQKEKVEEFAEQGLLSKKLATIDINVPIQFDADTFVIEEFDRERLKELFDELEFRTLSNSILGGQKATASSKKKVASAQGSLFEHTDEENTIATITIANKNIENTPHKYRLVQEEKERQNLVSLLSSVNSFCFDTETTAVDANEAELVGLAFSIKPTESYYVPIPADQEAAKSIVVEFKEVLENEQISKVGQNLKYDIIVLKWYDVQVKGTLFDTMLAHYLLEPELRHNLNYMSETYLDYKAVSIEELIGKKGKKQGSMRDVEVEKVKEYAGEDTDLTLQLKEHFEPKLQEEKELNSLFQTMENPLVYVLSDLEYEGIKVDVDFLKEYSKELTAGIIAKEDSIYEQAGAKFNIASPKQVGEILFDQMKIPYRWRKTKSGQYSTNEEKLTELSKEHPIVSDILKYRGLAKLKSTYVDALPKLINSKTGRVHSSFNQALVATGRLSSNNPNLQNIPIRTPEGRRVREAFVPRDSDHILLAADYSQIELRLVAEISNDEAMLEAFQSGQDIHRATAARVFEVAYDKVDSDQRRAAKTINFAIIYGAGATNISKQLDIKRKEASQLIDQYFKQYHGLRKYMDDSVNLARTQGYVTTLLGRRRYLRDINSKNGIIRSHAERNAMNTPIQGTAADMIKIAMINIHRAFKKQNIQSKMILQVHDELVFDVLRSEVEQVKALVMEEMKNALPNLKVPILVEAGLGEHWLEAH